MTDTLTADDIRAMPAGRTIDALVAERVMGWTDCDPDAVSTPWESWDDPPRTRRCIGKPPGWKPGNGRLEILHYSDDIDAAWEVVEFLAGKGCAFALSVHDCLWTMLLTRTTRPRSNCICTGETAPLTICRAALLATLES